MARESPRVPDSRILFWKVIEDEFSKLSTLEPSSSEYNVSKNYLDWLTVMPWNTNSEDNFDMHEAPMSVASLSLWDVASVFIYLAAFLNGLFPF